MLAAQAASDTPFNAKQTVRELELALSQGDLKPGDGEAPARLAEGVVKFSRDTFAFSYDLSRLTFALDRRPARRRRPN